MSREKPLLGLGAGVGIQPNSLVERAPSIDERFLTALPSCFAFIKQSEEAVFDPCGSISPW